MIPYIIMLLLCGLPLLFMELSMGQYTRRGPIGAIGKMCPIFQVYLSVLDIENLTINLIIHHEKNNMTSSLIYRELELPQLF